MDPTTPLAELAEMTAYAERHGYTGLWTNESNAREAFVVLAAWAARTERATLGTGVIPFYLRAPLTAAMAALTLAELAGPRVLLGIGAGHGAVARVLGASPESPLAGLSDYLTVLRSLLAGETAGEAVRLERPPQVSIPVLVAALGPRMLELAARLADGVLLNWAGPPEAGRAASRVKRLAGDRPFRVAAYVRVAVHDSEGRAREALAGQIESYRRLPAYRAHLERQGIVEVTSQTAVRLGVAGDPLSCREQLEAYHSAGLDELVVRPVPVEDGLWPVIEAMAPARPG